MKAAKSGHPGVVSLLIAAGADLNQKNNDGNTALMLAAYKNNLPICE